MFRRKFYVCERDARASAIRLGQHVRRIGGSCGVVVAILAVPDVRAKLTAAGYEIVASTPEEMAAQMKRERVKWSRVVAESDAKA